MYPQSVYPPFPDDDAWIGVEISESKKIWLEIVMNHSDIEITYCAKVDETRDWIPSKSHKCKNDTGSSREKRDDHQSPVCLDKAQWKKISETLEVYSIHTGIIPGTTLHWAMMASSMKQQR